MYISSQLCVLRLALHRFLSYSIGFADQLTSIPPLHLPAYCLDCWGGIAVVTHKRLFAPEQPWVVHHSGCLLFYIWPPRQQAERSDTVPKSLLTNLPPSSCAIYCCLLAVWTLMEGGGIAVATVPCECWFPLGPSWVVQSRWPLVMLLTCVIRVKPSGDTLWWCPGWAEKAANPSRIVLVWVSLSALGKWDDCGSCGSCGLWETEAPGRGRGSNVEWTFMYCAIQRIQGGRSWGGWVTLAC